MILTVAQIRGEHSISLQTYAKGEVENSETIIDLETFDQPEYWPDLIIVHEDEHQQKLVKFKNVCPIETLPSDKTIDYKENTFQTISEIYQNSHNRWSLENNVTTIENMVKIVGHLKELYIKDRGACFEEIWEQLRMNLNSSELTVIFNDVEMPESDDKKPKLIKAVVTGKKRPVLRKAKESEEAILEHFSKDIKEELQLLELNLEEGKLVYSAQIEGSPILILAKIFDYNRIQQAVVKGLIESISH